MCVVGGCWEAESAAERLRDVSALMIENKSCKNPLQVQHLCSPGLGEVKSILTSTSQVHSPETKGKHQLLAS